MTEVAIAATFMKLKNKKKKKDITIFSGTGESSKGNFYYLCNK